jgi:hypothetical protein
MEATLTLSGKLLNPEGDERAVMSKGFADTRVELLADGTVKVTFILPPDLAAGYLSDASATFEKPIAG